MSCGSSTWVTRVEGWVYEPGVGLNLMEVPQGLKARCITGTRVRVLVRVKTTGLSSLKGWNFGAQKTCSILVMVEAVATEQP